MFGLSWFSLLWLGFQPEPWSFDHDPWSMKLYGLFVRGTSLLWTILRVSPAPEAAVLDRISSRCKVRALIEVFVYLFCPRNRETAVPEEFRGLVRTLRNQNMSHDRTELRASRDPFLQLTDFGFLVRRGGRWSQVLGISGGLGFGMK